MIVGSNGSVYVNSEHPAYPHLSDFLTSCCEPVCRTHHMSEYRLSPSSLSASSAEGTYSTAMIRNFIRYFRLDEEKRLPVDVAKFAALERQLHEGAFMDNDPKEGAAAAAVKRSREEATKTETPFPHSVKLEKREEDEDEEAKGTKLLAVHTAVGPAPALPRRTFSLVRRRPKTETTEKPNDTLEKLTKPSPEPLVAKTLQCPDAIQPLPADLEQMLAEEESSAKVRIVLQPRLRSFQRRSGENGTHHGHPGNNGREESEEEKSGLAYFLVSPDRHHMEYLVARLQDYLVPVMLHGTPRWVLSDVDRGVEERSVVESGRTFILRLLFDTPRSADAVNTNKDGASTGAEGRRYSRLVYKSQVRDGRLRNVRERLFKEMGVRADLFYDYAQDTTLHVPNLTLAEHVRLRPYQVASLERFRRGDKAHQGVIVLPCGAGKTLTGIGASCTVKKRTIVMCINVMSVLQWQREFLRWTNLTEEQVTVCVSDKKQIPGDVFITTYNMMVVRRPVTAQQEQSEDARLTARVLAAATEEPWGLLVLDEVHTALARHFQEVLNKVKYKCVIGLSATLLREDDKIDDLRHLVGPKLYEANWLELTRAGFLARVECAEVQCPMPLSYFSEYISQTADNTTNATSLNAARPLARAIACLNPFKLWCAQALLEFHRNRSPPDKVILFCDDIDGVHFYAQYLHIPLMDGRTGEAERENLLRYFQFSSEVNAIILSRVGDVALDLPCASVIIQISGLGASRRQEAQRLGRILRPKPPSLDNTCSFFYTLVSQDTDEVRQGYDRQSWLRDQGFAYRVLRAAAVLREFKRTGGRRCCVGPPRWWYESDPHSNAATTKSDDGWVSFSREASERIQYRFVSGREDCVLNASFLLHTPRPAEMGNDAVEEKWILRFSAANAPETFGTVQFREDRPDFLRRICNGPRDPSHDCLGNEECLHYALEHVRRTVERRSKQS